MANLLGKYDVHALASLLVSLTYRFVQSQRSCRKTGYPLCTGPQQHLGIVWNLMQRSNGNTGMTLSFSLEVVLT